MGGRGKSGCIPAPKFSVQLGKEQLEESYRHQMEASQLFRDFSRELSEIVVCQYCEIPFSGKRERCPNCGAPNKRH